MLLLILSVITSNGFSIITTQEGQEELKTPSGNKYARA